MEQFIYLTLTGFFSALITWFFSRKSNLIDIEIKAASLYQNMLNDATKRLNQAIDTINERDEKIKVLMLEIELLTDELKKFKQLNGKS